MSGKVWLAGAGPGDPQLLTLRAARLLESADVVVLDALVSDDVRQLIHPSAEIIYAGKRAGAHSMPQEQINVRLIELARAGKRVVRLKGGDPFVFGRGGEEAQELRDAGIEFEIVPGVTAGVAGPAYAGIPVTFRALSSSVTLVTGHEADVTSGVNWQALADLRGTVVFYMGLSRLEAISRSLIEAGRSRDTPVAVIAQATTPLQRSVRGTLADIVERMAAAELQAPALILVGEVAALAETLSWFENRPLFGRTVVVTRARAQASELRALLEEEGARVLEVPAIRFAPPDSWAQLDAVLARLESYAWIVFSSINGVESFFERLHGRGLDARALAQSKIAAVGQSTAEGLRRRGLIAELVPERFQSSALLPHFPADLRGTRFAVIRALAGNDEFLDELRSRGAEVDLGVAYQTFAERDGFDHVESLLEKGEIDAVTFTSGSTVQHFCDQLRSPGLLAGVRAVSIGPVTSRALESAGLRVAATAKQATVASLAEAVRELLSPHSGE